MRPRAIALAAAAALLLGVAGCGGCDGGGLRELAVIEPIRAALPNVSSSPGAFEEARMKGLTAYKRADYDDAVERLATAHEIHKENSEVLLYLGSAELLRGESAKAVQYLRLSAEAAMRAPLKHEAQWQLANAYLASAEADSAEAVLQRVIEEARARSAAATDLLARLRAAVPAS